MKEINYNNLPQAVEEINDRLIDIKNLLIIQGRDPANKSDQFMNLSEVCEMLNLKKQTIYAMVSNRMIPHSKVGGRLRFLRSEIHAWISQGKRKTLDELKDEV